MFVCVRVCGFNGVNVLLALNILLIYFSHLAVRKENEMQNISTGSGGEINNTTFLPLPTGSTGQFESNSTTVQGIPKVT